MKILTLVREAAFQSKGSAWPPLHASRSCAIWGAQASWGERKRLEKPPFGRMKQINTCRDQIRCTRRSQISNAPQHRRP